MALSWRCRWVTGGWRGSLLGYCASRLWQNSASIALGQCSVVRLGALPLEGFRPFFLPLSFFLLDDFRWWIRPFARGEPRPLVGALWAIPIRGALTDLNRKFAAP